MKFFSAVRTRLAILAASAAVLVSASAAAADAPTGQTIDGISCDQAEGAVFHIHQHLAIVARGKPVAIPSDVGRPIAGSCLYWIHTHTSDGLIHVESPKFRTFVLGEFFDVWGQPLDATAAGPARGKKGELRAYVDGRPYKGDPRKIELSQHTDVTLEVGPPYTKPAAFTDWQGQ